MTQTWPQKLLSVLAVVGLSACGGGGSAPDVLPSFQAESVSAASLDSALPADWHEGVFAEIFVRAYQDSNGDGIGDFDGLISRLDYLKSLGVSGVWLMPIYPSQDGDHGYAVKDYRDVAADFGGLSGFQRFVKAAHERGIGVVLDYLLNHSAAQHPAFVNAASGSGNPWRDWYIWQGTKPTGWSIYGSNPWHWRSSGYYFGGFWSEMPDFNLRNEAVLSWHEDNLRFWLNQGVDGFRFDAVGNLVENGPDAWENQAENHVILQRMRQVIGGYTNRFLVCEAPATPKAYADAGSCGHAFAFGYQYDLSAAVRGDAAALDRVLAYWRDAQGMVGFASNHDAFAGQRVADQLGGDDARMRLLAATYLLQSRSPFIYYGEEIGMRGASGLSGDPALRTPMSWRNDAAGAGFTSATPFRALAANVASANVEQQEGDADSLLNFYRQVIAVRNACSALRSGGYTALARQGMAWGFQRADGQERVTVLYNYGAAATDYALSNQKSGAELVSAWPPNATPETVDAQGQLNIKLAAHSFRVLVQRLAP